MTTHNLGGRRLGQATHVMLSDEIKAFTLGVALTEAEDEGMRTPSEGDVIRRLLALAIPVARRKMGVDAYARAVRVGRQELERRKETARRNAAMGASAS